MMVNSKEKIRFSLLATTLLILSPSILIVYQAPPSMSTFDAVVKLVSALLVAFATGAAVITLLIALLFVLAGSVRIVREGRLRAGV